jgi:hypothetical protein
MTIPAKGWLVLRRLSSKRPPQHSVEQKWGGVGVQTQAFSSDCPYGFEIGQRSGRMATSEAVNGKSRLN